MTTKTLTHDGVTYRNPAHVKFVKDMTKAGIEVELYQGRFFWRGPMARTDEENGPTLEEVMSATKIKVQRDNCAFDWCVYPVVNDPTLGGPMKKTARHFRK